MTHSPKLTAEDLRTACPDVAGTVRLSGLNAPVDVYRDEYGIPHVRASSEADAFFAQGFVTAQDRLWQMEYDRRRGLGCWAEAVGPSGVEQDRLMRRCLLERSARADYEAVGVETRAMFDAYAAGINAFIATAEHLPVEFEITGLTPEPWQPWDGLVVYKVRHLFMGAFEAKVLRAQLVQALGAEKTASVFPGFEPGQLLIMPPGERYRGALQSGLEELTRGAAALNYLPGPPMGTGVETSCLAPAPDGPVPPMGAGVETSCLAPAPDGNETGLGSNSWVLAGSRTASGRPILAGDSHRGLDTPNVYYQNHLACPEFDVVGLSFPGLPGFPHFGHNPWAAWCVTHAWADYQDLFIERFNPDDAGYYLWRDQWRRAEVQQQTIKVRGGGDAPPYEVTEVVWHTHHGPIIAGDPSAGAGLALCYTATDGPSVWPDTLRKMLVAQDSDELVESMREWVDPCNNFLFADVKGSIGYLCRGEIPVRPRTNAWLPVPGWTGEHEWTGRIPFDEMPRSLNPAAGYYATANNKPVGDEYPYHIGVDFSPDYRVESVSQALRSLDRPSAADMAKIHAQRRSIPARTFVKLLRGVDPLDESSAWAKDLLLDWSGDMDAGLVAPTIFSAARDALLERLLRHNLGDGLAKQALNPAGRGAGVFLTRFKSLLVTAMEGNDTSLLPTGAVWEELAAESLAQGLAMLREQFGPVPPMGTGVETSSLAPTPDGIDTRGWEWGKVHQARPAHTLSSAFPGLAPLLDPPAIPMSGDNDTPLAGAYAPAQFAKVGGLSVARYSFDLSDWSNCLWAVPLGSSGHPGSPHYSGQTEVWRQVQMVPMHYDWGRIAAGCETIQRLEPGN